MKVKICCISSILEAKLAISAGASAIGLVGPMPSGPGIITDEEIAQIVNTIPTHIDTFLLTSCTTASEIITHYRKVKTSVIQIVDAIPYDAYDQIRMELPNVKLVQVIHVMNEESIDEAKSLEDKVDMILLDSGNPNAAIKELGGTGKTHNWEISRAIVENLRVPVFLAGGLNAANVSQAISKVTPHGVDLCSGVRTNNQLDEIKLNAFFKEIHKATE